MCRIVRSHEIEVAALRRSPFAREALQHRGGILPIARNVAHERRMAGIPIASQRTHIRHGRAQRIAMDVAHEGQEVRFVLAQNGFVSILKQMPDTVVATVESGRVSGQQRPHRLLQRLRCGSHEKMEMIRHQSPRVHDETTVADDRRDTSEQVFPIGVVFENRAPFDTTCDDVMKRVRRVESWPTRHSGCTIAHGLVAVAS